MSRSRRLILSIYRGSSLTQLFIRRECRLYSLVVSRRFSSHPRRSMQQKGTREEGEGGGRRRRRERERLCNPARFTYHVLRRNETPIELRTCCSARADVARCTHADHLFSATRKRGFRQELTSIARFYKVVIFVKIWLDEFDSNGNRRFSNYIALWAIRPFGKLLCCHGK